MKKLPCVIYRKGGAAAKLLRERDRFYTRSSLFTPPSPRSSAFLCNFTLMKQPFLLQKLKEEFIDLIVQINNILMSEIGVYEVTLL